MKLWDWIKSQPLSEIEKLAQEEIEKAYKAQQKEQEKQRGD